MELKKGLKIDGYTLESHLGSGGVAEVWKVTDSMGMTKALKMVCPSNRLDQQTIDMFMKEYKLTMDIYHPNILTAQKLGDYQGRPYIIMPICESSLSQDLSLRIQHQKNRLIPYYSELELALIINHTARGLKTLNDKGIMHNDIKSANILRKTEDGGLTYVIADFGISTKLRQTIIQQTQTYENYNSNAGITPDYAAPERFKGQIHPGSDIFSLSVLIYELATGNVPFQNPNYAPGELIIRGFTPPEIEKDYSNRIKNIIKLGLIEDPDKRPSAEDLISWTDMYLTDRFWPNEIEERVNSLVQVKKKRKKLNLKFNKKWLYSAAAVIGLLGFSVVGMNMSFANKLQYSSSINSSFLRNTFLMGKNKKTYNVMKQLNLQYDKVEPFRGNYAKVRAKNGKYGYVNLEGQLIIPCEFDDVGLLGSEDNYTIFELNGNCGFVSIDNKRTEAKYYNCVMVNKSQASVQLKNEYGKLIPMRTITIADELNGE